MIEIAGLEHVYMRGTPFQTRALNGIDLRVRAGEGVALAGATGSGKTTLLLHLNGLLRPHAGSVRVGDTRVGERGGDLLELRRRVGVLFQFPEQQLFEETLAEDVAYGPRNFGVRGSELAERVDEALLKVGLDPVLYRQRSVHELSGGEKRLAALAGALASRPEVLVLDEPTAGLDGRARRALLGSLARWRAEEALTLVIVSHHLEELPELVDRLVVLAQGRVVGDGPLEELFGREEWMSEQRLEVPPVTRLAARLREAGRPVERLWLTVEQAEHGLSRMLEGGG